jgi:broad specificity phosphatase PhoE
LAAAALAAASPDTALAWSDAAIAISDAKARPQTLVTVTAIATARVIVRNPVIFKASNVMRKRFCGLAKIYNSAANSRWQDEAFCAWPSAMLTRVSRARFRARLRNRAQNIRLLPNPQPAMTQPNATHIWLIRHGETEWSKSGRHTGTSDIPLTDAGRAQAAALEPLLAAQPFDLVLTSPMQRAIETCRLAGLGERSQIEPNLHEWNYGVYEGRKTADIRADVPDWSVWTSTIPEGENAADVGRRAQALIDQLLGTGAQHIALFSHAHFLRTLGAVWASGAPALGAHLVMDTAAVSVLGFEREVPAILKWNLQS